MRVSYRVAYVAVLLAVPAAVQAQNELSNFTATGRGGVINTFAQDYQALGINPANLGRPDAAAVTFTIGEVGAGIGSRSLSKTLFKHIIYDADQAIGPAEKAALLGGFAGENALNFNIDATTFALGVSLPNGLGGLAVSNRVRMSSHLALNRNGADVIVNGKNAQSIKPYYDSNTGMPTQLPPPLISTFLNGTAIQLAWTSEYNVAYGVRVLDLPLCKVSVGAGYRYIEGIGVADIRAEEGKLSAYTALSPIFGVDYSSLNSSQFNYKNGSGLQPVGRGHGYDAGVSTELGKALRVGVSVTDMGSMTWAGNVVTAQDQTVRYPTSDGIDSYDVFNELVDQFASQGSLFEYKGAQERTAALPAKLRLGAGFRVSKLFEVGVDYTAPLNKVAGNITSPFVGLGLDFKPVRWVRLSTGVSSGAGYGTSLPLGLTLVSSFWEAGVSSRDVTGYFNEKSPYYSVALGFLRFKIGNKEAQ